MYKKHTVYKFVSIHFIARSAGRLDSLDFNYRCRKTQKKFDDCVFDKLGWERPPIGYFSRIRLIDSGRKISLHICG